MAGDNFLKIRRFKIQQQVKTHNLYQNSEKKNSCAFAQPRRKFQQWVKEFDFSLAYSDVIFNKLNLSHQAEFFQWQ